MLGSPVEKTKCNVLTMKVLILIMLTFSDLSAALAAAQAAVAPSYPEFDPDAIIQESEVDPDEAKPRFKRAKLTEMPIRREQRREEEQSNLCSIM